MTLPVTCGFRQVGRVGWRSASAVRCPRAPKNSSPRAKRPSNSAIEYLRSDRHHLGTGRALHRSADGALEILEQARPHLRGADLARLETARNDQDRVGDLADAERDYLSAQRRFAGTGDDVGLVRLLVNVGILHVQRCDLRRSEAELRRLLSWRRRGQGVAAAAALHNLGYARSGPDSSQPRSTTSPPPRPSSSASPMGPCCTRPGRSGRRPAPERPPHRGGRCCDDALEGVPHTAPRPISPTTPYLPSGAGLPLDNSTRREWLPRRASCSCVASIAQLTRRLAEFALAEIEATEKPTTATGEAICDSTPARAVGRPARRRRPGAGRQLFLGAGDVDRAADVLGGLRVVADPPWDRAAAYLARGCWPRRDATGAARAACGADYGRRRDQTNLGGLEFPTFAARHGRRSSSSVPSWGSTITTRGSARSGRGDAPDALAGARATPPSTMSSPGCSPSFVS